MRRRFAKGKVALGLALSMVALAAGDRAMARDCDRACAAALADQALAAFQAGVPGKVLKSARITENGREIRLADSQLHAIRAVTSVRSFSDVAGTAVGMIGAADAAGGAEIFAIRLRVKGDAVTEAETLVVRRGESPVFAPLGLAKSAAALEDGGTGRAPGAVSPEQFEAVAATALASADTTAMAAPCVTWENGVRREGCGGLAGAPGATVRDRRVALVDPGQGLIWVIGVADAPATPTRREPHSVLAAWLLRVSGGHLEQAVVVMRDAPAGASAGWALPKPKKK